MLRTTLILCLLAVPALAAGKDDVQALKDRIAELEKENASLKKQIAYLKKKETPKFPKSVNPKKPRFFFKATKNQEGYSTPVLADFKLGQTGFVKGGGVEDILEDGSAICEIAVDYQIGNENIDITSRKVVLTGVEFKKEGEFFVNKTFRAVKKMPPRAKGETPLWLLEPVEKDQPTTSSAH